MEDLNEYPVSDFNGCYLRFRSLVSCYVQYKLIKTDYVFYDEIIDEVVENLIFEADIFNVPRKSPYFWWGFVRRRGGTVVQRYLNDQSYYEHLEALEFDFKNNPRNFYRFTEKRLKELIRTGTFPFILSNLEIHDKELGSYLQKQIKSYMSNAPTDVLVHLYKSLCAVQTREFKSCEHNVKGLWYREQPSRRRSMRK